MSHYVLKIYKITIITYFQVETCSICMELVTEEPGVDKPLIDKKKKKTVRVMRTPCNHYFHEKCLKEWMDIKLECPFCRTRLPPLE